MNLHYSRIVTTYRLRGFKGVDSYLFVLSTTSPVFAQTETLVAVSLYDAISLPPASAVKGLRLNLFYGKHDYVSGLDLGVISHTVYKNTGVLIAGVQLGHKSSGLRVSLLNVVDEMSGLQLGLLNFNKFGNGPSLGLVYNEAAIKSVGQQLGLWNMAGESEGIQFGVFNYAAEFEGMQFGLINVAGKMSDGLQLGLLNFSNGGGISCSEVVVVIDFYMDTAVYWACLNGVVNFEKITCPK
jgi:hypothetical protein